MNGKLGKTIRTLRISQNYVVLVKKEIVTAGTHVETKEFYHPFVADGTKEILFMKILNYTNTKI